MNIFLICPVRIATDEQKEKLKKYVEYLESEGFKVHYPARDTNQIDPTGGYNILCENTLAIRKSDEIHIFWDKNSKGSLFDLGVAFALNKPLVIANPEDIEPTEGKSFENAICEWSFRSEDWIF